MEAAGSTSRTPGGGGGAGGCLGWEGGGGLAFVWVRGWTVNVLISYSRLFALYYISCI